MKFFDRQNEIAKLREIRSRSRENATFTVMTGRRRVGKTELVKMAFADEPFVYLFVTRSAEADLCENEFKGTIDFFEVKRDAKRHDRKLLEEKVEAFFVKNPKKRKLMATVDSLSLADV